MAAFQVEMMKNKEIEKIKRQLQLPSEEELAKLVSAITCPLTLKQVAMCPSVIHGVSD